ncbi:MAG: hypothetical protein R3A79_23720 [Nannocystaceae bacterium]
MHGARRSWSLLSTIVGAAACSAALSGCFADSGTQPTSAQASDASSSTTATSTSDASTGTSTGEGPTTGASESTGDETTGTATTEPTTTGECSGECTPGDAEEGAACGCGVERRTCQLDCTWSEWACEGADACGLWTLPAGKDTWDAIPWASLGNPDHAPTAAIEASFGVDAVRQGVVFTHETFHVLDLDTLAWIKSGSRGSIFPELNGVTLVAAYSVNGGLSQGLPPTATEGLTFLSADHVWIYEDFAPATLTATYSSDKPCCDDNEDWQTADAPDPALVRGFWLDLVGDELWIDPDISGCDGLPEGTKMVAYAAGISTANGGTAHVDDIGLCFDFIYSAPLASYPPMTLPSAPTSAALVGGAFFVDGIYVVGSSP